ncbi:LamG domain-containing protein [Amnibacterium sp. CER49]|uniref:LamG-like jellyroll fold domain-containing protein n=1 Tax=Amnibacterium sp. CER49 TaxID=3039161 RepID=UPI002448477F|nr:LamG-like jellyroll fold domain-containing protein [Amnibacterium sp. CER49]MDH2444005.1 LamG domain-containing protein [Amnibacterium sp. CER49]
MRRGRAPLYALAAGAVVAAALALTTPGTTGGFVAKVTNSTNTAGTAPYFTCAGATTADGSASGSFVWALNESTGTSAADGSGHSLAGTYGATITSSATGAPCARDTGGALQVSTTGTAGNYVYSALSSVSALPFSEEIWFKAAASTTNGGQLLGIGDSYQSASNKLSTSTALDRVLYLNATGYLVFGARTSSSSATLTSQTKLNDGVWHHVVVTVSSSTTTVYIDGAAATMTLSGTMPVSTTLVARSSQYWRVGYDDDSGWTGGTKNYFTGSVRFAAFYNSTVLTSTQVQSHWIAGS